MKKKLIQKVFLGKKRLKKKEEEEEGIWIIMEIKWKGKKEDSKCSKQTNQQKNQWPASNSTF